MISTQTLNIMVQLATLVGAVIGVVVWHQRSIGSLRDQLHARINELKDEVHDVELKAAEKYATEDTFKHFEKKTLDAIKGLGDRIDKALAGR